MKHRNVILGIGVGALLWYWYRMQQTSSADSSTSNGSGVLDTILAKVMPGSNSGSSTPPGELSTLLGKTETIAGPKPRPAYDSWLWVGGDDPGKVVSIAEYNAFDKGRCTDGHGNPVECNSVGRGCTRGFDCLPTDPGYKK